MTVTEMVRAEYPNMSDEAVALHGRHVRNVALSACDWTQTSDSPVDKAAWAEYRQALRDLPAQPDWPNVPMPTVPAV